MTVVLVTVPVASAEDCDNVAGDCVPVVLMTMAVALVTVCQWC